MARRWRGPVGRAAAALLLAAAVLVPGHDSGQGVSVLTVIAEPTKAAMSAADGIVAVTDGRSTTVSSRQAPPGRMDAVLEATLRDLAPRDRNVIVLASRGRWPARTATLVRQSAEAGHPVFWQPTRGVHEPVIIGVRAPARAAAGEPIFLEVRHEAPAGAALDVVLEHEGARLARVSASPDEVTRLSLEAPRTGVLQLDAELADRSTGEPVDRLTGAAIVNIAGRPALLVVSRDRSALGDALAGGGWPVVRMQPHAWPAAADSLGRYGAIILDNVPADGVPDAAWRSLAAAVRESATGLLVLGGPDAFGLGAYRGSVLESVLPVVSEPPAPDQPADLVFLVDVSGSMGRDDYGALRAARDAVVATARALTPTDRTGLVAFEAEARVLLASASREDHARALRAAFPDRASGGTRLLPAIRTGLAMLADAGQYQRLLVLVTDGQLADDDLAALDAGLHGKGAELIAIVVGDADADVPVERLDAGENVTVIVSRDLAGLPALMRDEVESRRPAFATGPAEPVVVRAGFLPDAADRGWPPLDAWLVTRPRPEATVYLVAPGGEPLLVTGTAGAGRVAVLTGGLGAWAGDWLGWEHWPALAAGVVEAVAVGSTGPSAIAYRRGAAEVVIDTGIGSQPPRRVVLTTPTGVVEVRAEPLAPGRWRVPLPEESDGVWQLAWETDARRWRHAFLAGHDDPGGPDQILASDLVEVGVLRRWQGEASMAALSPPLPLRRGLALAALLVFLATLALERYVGGALAPIAVRWPGRDRDRA
ncbi:VWA domain-containing protein [Lentisalinibacter salinarum]|uniref:VWA domain-containing protein n=1 Tax=Lentisalinibacter salinarum TaxID=2992239 RepID=UPI003867B7DF